MNNFIKAVVNRPVTVIVVFVLILGVGAYSFAGLAVDLLPDVNPPFLFVSSFYVGAGPEEVEELVSKPMERVFSNVSHVKNIYSSSFEGLAQVSLEFNWGVDIDDAANDVRDQIEVIRGILPTEATAPQIFKFDPSQVPVMDLILSGKRSPEELRVLAEDTVQPRLEQIAGVAQAAITGGRERIIEVSVPLNRLEAYGLTLSEISNAIGMQNSDISIGNIQQSGIDYLIEAFGEFSSLDDIRNTVITYRGGQVGVPAAAILIRDIADVTDTYADSDSIKYVNGQPAVTITLQKQSGSNSVQVVNIVRDSLDAINVALPIGTEVSVLSDSTTLIRNTISQVSQAALGGAILAILVLLIFLRDGLVTFIIGTSIPISVVTTLMIMYFTNLTLNIMTLTGLALGIGMLVDNSIVILENIYRYLEKGAKPKTAALLGTREMLSAVLSSTLTTICVFAPILAFRSRLEVYGEFFSELAFTVIISLTTSLISAIFLVPTLSALLLKRRSSANAKKRRFLEGFFRGLNRVYGAMLRFSLRFRWLTILVAIGALIGSVLLIPSIGFIPFPPQGQDIVSLSVEMPAGTELDETYEVLRQMEKIVLEEVQGFDNIVLEVGGSGDFGGVGRSHSGSLDIILPEFSRRIDDANTVRQKLRRHFDTVPGAVMSFGSSQGGRRGGFTPPPIDIIINSDDYNLAINTSQQIRDMLDDAPEIAEPVVDSELGRPQVRVVMDRNRLNTLGLNISAVGQELRASVNGITASRYRTAGKEYDIVVIGDERNRDQIVDLENIYVPNRLGQRIPVANFAHLDYATGPSTIERENQKRAIHITADRGIDETGRVYDNAAEVARALIDENIVAGDELVISYGGDAEAQSGILQQFMFVMVIAVILVFGVMASQFESLRDPFIIFLSIPLVIIGVVLIHYLTNDVLSLLGIVGIIMLSGIVVNNGIVLVDYTNILRRRGKPIMDACLEAGVNRLRPILMTNITTICGLLPVALYSGDNSTLVQPIAKSVVGGLSVSAFMTLFIVPVVYFIFHRAQERRLARVADRRDKREQRRQANALRAEQKRKEKNNGGVDR